MDVMPYVLDVLLIMSIVGFFYFAWRRLPQEKRVRTLVMRPLVLSVFIIAVLLACRFFHVLCFDNK